MSGINGQHLIFRNNNAHSGSDDDPAVLDRIMLNIASGVVQCAHVIFD